MTTARPLEFLPARYGDGTLVDDPTAADLAIFAHEHGLADNDSEIGPDTAQHHANTWGVYDHYYWAGYYGSPMPPLPIETSSDRSAA